MRAVVTLLRRLLQRKPPKKRTAVMPPYDQPASLRRLPHQHQPTPRKPTAYEKYGYTGGGDYPNGTFVLCMYEDEYSFPKEDFGKVVKFIPPDIYVVDLQTEEGYVKVHTAHLRKAGQT